MIVRETLPNFASWSVSILATDISDAAIAQASRGWYAAHEIDRGMRASLLPKYFKPHQGGWQVKDELREWFPSSAAISCSRSRRWGYST